MLGRSVRVSWWRCSGNEEGVAAAAAAAAGAVKKEHAFEYVDMDWIGIYYENWIVIVKNDATEEAQERIAEVQKPGVVAILVVAVRGVVEAGSRPDVGAAKKTRRLRIPTKRSAAAAIV